jgi:hypothetical protein
MQPLLFTADVSALAWTALATVVLLLVPGVVYAYYVLDRWIDDDASYLPVMASVDHRSSPGSRPGPKPQS